VKVKKVNLYGEFIFILHVSLKRSNMPASNKVITQFYLPPIHKPYLPLLLSRKALSAFGWY